ncbi:NPCBM/NEW2 domain-containing protein [candidate division KSB1 bacterium]|nr:NPCBM/NEW2 domain-containing protein [candidate division KSB1 bacterium]
MVRLLFSLVAVLSLFIYCGKETQRENTSDRPEFLNWAPTPPMGWNSWDCYGPTVTEKEVKANADYMAEHLKEFGWEYIVVDIRWYVENTKTHGYNEKDPIFVLDEYGRFLPSPARFPSSADGKGFKPLADYVHGKGLKFGIHIMRGIPKEAVKRNTPVLGSTATANDIYSEKMLCRWLGDMYTIDAGKEGAQEYYNSIFDLYASWGVDFIKVDDLSSPYYHKEEIEKIRKAIDQTGRQIVLSTSPGATPIENVEHIKVHANMWRIINDFWDNWPQLKEEFDVCNLWSPHIGNGHFPDADMLPLGRIGIRAERGNDRRSGFTRDEQYTLMTLFAICRSPLMFGGDLPSNDDFTLSLLTNRKVLDVNKSSTKNRQLFRKDDLIAWTAENPETGDTYLALFNAQDQREIVESKALWKSDVLSSTTKQSVDIDVEIDGARKLYLVVDQADKGNHWDHADWIEPKLTGAKGELLLTNLKWIKATCGWNRTVLNKSVTRNALIVDGTEYANGIGTHSNSVIEYDIPEGYDRFSAKAGLDNACISHPEGASVQFLIFTQNPAGPAPAESAPVSVQFEQLGLTGACQIQDLWSGKDLGVFEKEFTPVITRHGAGLYRIVEQK